MYVKKYDIHIKFKFYKFKFLRELVVQHGIGANFLQFEYLIVICVFESP